MSRTAKERSAESTRRVKEAVWSRPPQETRGIPFLGVGRRGDGPEGGFQKPPRKPVAFYLWATLAQLWAALGYNGLSFSATWLSSQACFVGSFSLCGLLGSFTWRSRDSNKGD